MPNLKIGSCSSWEDGMGKQRREPEVRCWPGKRVDAVHVPLIEDWRSLDCCEA